MKLDTRKLLRMLGMTIHKQKDLWTSVVYRPVKDQNTEIGPDNRDETVRWLAHLNKKLKFHPETLATSVAIFDRFLTSVKAHPKYLKIIAVACLYLSAKTIEEDQLIPQTLEFCQASQCGCSVAEILRMEKVILNKLGWDLRSVTALDFLQIYHSLLMNNYPNLLKGWSQMTQSRHLSLLTRKVLLCIAYNGLLSFSPAALSLTVLSLELELFHKDWFAITTGLQNLVQVDSDNLILCREKTTFYFSSINHRNTIYLQTPTKHTQPLPPSPSHAAKAAKRKVKDIEDNDDVYDALKRLYNEEESPSTAQQHLVTTTKGTTGTKTTIASSCSSEILHDSSVQTVPIQPVVN